MIDKWALKTALSWYRGWIIQRINQTQVDPSDDGLGELL